MSEIKKFRADHSDPDSADLFVFEYSKLPWIPARMYVMQNFVEGRTRGNHAHKRLSQIFIMISGSLQLEIYRGENCQSVILTPQTGELELKPGAWRVISNASKDAVLLVLADEAFYEEDYIREWDLYLNWYKQNGE
jgi:dTDP-4-dehydrorhamnose 3,5-epimerase-like enzyme